MSPLVLGIESTAHTLGIAILRGRDVLANVRKAYTTQKGGMVPAKVALHHEEAYEGAMREALQVAGDSMELYWKLGAPRRVNAVDPESSLLLAKPSMKIPHGGGMKMTRRDVAYKLLRDWMAELGQRTSVAVSWVGRMATPLRRLVPGAFFAAAAFVAVRGAASVVVFAVTRTPDRGEPAPRAARQEEFGHLSTGGIAAADHQCLERQSG